MTTDYTKGKMHRKIPKLIPISIKCFDQVFKKRILIGTLRRVLDFFKIKFGNKLQLN